MSQYSIFEVGIEVGSAVGIENIYTDHQIQLDKAAISFGPAKAKVK